MSANALILSRSPAILWVLSQLGKYLAPQGETLQKNKRKDSAPQGSLIL